jgi:hypothetical protein
MQIYTPNPNIYIILFNQYLLLVFRRCCQHFWRFNTSDFLLPLNYTEGVYKGRFLWRFRRLSKAYQSLTFVRSTSFIPCVLSFIQAVDSKLLLHHVFHLFPYKPHEAMSILVQGVYKGRFLPRFFHLSKAYKSLTLVTIISTNHFFPRVLSFIQVVASKLLLHPVCPLFPYKPHEAMPILTLKHLLVHPHIASGARVASESTTILQCSSQTLWMKDWGTLYVTSDLILVLLVQISLRILVLLSSITLATQKEVRFLKGAL